MEPNVDTRPLPTASHSCQPLQMGCSAQAAVKEHFSKTCGLAMNGCAINTWCVNAQAGMGGSGRCYAIAAEYIMTDRPQQNREFGMRDCCREGLRTALHRHNLIRSAGNDCEWDVDVGQAAG